VNPPNDSASFQLLNSVDGVWTVASNVGPVAAFLGRPVGAPPDSHIAYSADNHTIGELLDKARIQKAPTAKRVFDWMFERYIIPSSKIDEPNWLADYILARD